MRGQWARRDARIGLSTRGLPIRRNIANCNLAFFSTWWAAGTGIEMLVKIEGHHWAIEDSFGTAKNEDNYIVLRE